MARKILILLVVLMFATAAIAAGPVNEDQFRDAYRLTVRQLSEISDTATRSALVAEFRDAFIGGELSIEGRNVTIGQGEVVLQAASWKDVGTCSEFRILPTLTAGDGLDDLLTWAFDDDTRVWFTPAEAEQRRNAAGALGLDWTMTAQHCGIEASGIKSQIRWVPLNGASPGTFGDLPVDVFVTARQASAVTNVDEIRGTCRLFSLSPVDGGRLGCVVDIDYLQ